ncbi:ABC-F family ATP-binding cassette domain-containing protein [Zhihengliuella salsuginis]|uniref:ABC transporter ATP-binding protein n=1 Tax=Zhihengliuella salsuginis TaxID=578222 RepID=A0ABQ3GA42_9MICC|nr:ATP-binding cassette domain-containing protein [Zhihengliuella salsuginis]GHC99366.1 ABC transporter ATP-binding protein [Zhihengliuella salsuginis]
MTRPPASPRPHRECVLRGATARWAERVVLRDVDLAVGPRDRLGLVGDNGAGKSTLLGLIAGTVEPADGERRVEIPGGLAFAEQRPTFAPGASVTGALDALLADLRRLESEVRTLAEQAALATGAEQQRLLARLGRATDAFEARDGYGVETRLDAALEQLGLGDLERSRPVAELSGGEQARLALAAALSAEAELLLLDEPTNDLDEAAMDWLEARLVEHRGALVVVTHDRDFLDRVAADIVAIDDGRLTRYGSGYAGYLDARAAERRRLAGEHEAWKRDLARNQELVEANSSRLDAMPRKQEKPGFGHGSFRARGRDHGARSRIRIAKERVERLRDEPAPPPPEPLRFAPAFAAAENEREEGVVLTAEGVVLGSAESPPRLRLERLEVAAGDRWLVSGPNGAGKTTLLRVLAGELAPDAGSVVRRAGTRTGWLHQDFSARSRRPLLDAFAAAIRTYREDAVLPLLRSGLFGRDDLGRPVVDLSVGQRRRFELAVAVTAPSDLLLLDEPTNHLAPELVEQLEDALEDYPGAVVTVTHDRRWRRRAAGGQRLDVSPGGVVSRG